MTSFTLYGSDSVNYLLINDIFMKSSNYLRSATLHKQPYYLQHHILFAVIEA